MPAELVYGALYVRESPSLPHQRAVKDFLLALNPFVEKHALGEVLIAPLDVILDAERALIVQPDLLFISHARDGVIKGDHVRGAPDMILEVLSPHPRIGDLNQRLGWFAQYGVRECWVARLPERRLDIIRCAEGVIAGRSSFAWHDSIESEVFAGFNPSLWQILQHH